jgi:hypothetical protein
VFRPEDSSVWTSVCIGDDIVNVRLPPVVHEEATEHAKNRNVQPHNAVLVICSEVAGYVWIWLWRSCPAVGKAQPVGSHVSFYNDGTVPNPGLSLWNCEVILANSISGYPTFLFIRGQLTDVRMRDEHTHVRVCLKMRISSWSLSVAQSFYGESSQSFGSRPARGLFFVVCPQLIVISQLSVVTNIRNLGTCISFLQSIYL